MNKKALISAAAVVIVAIAALYITTGSFFGFNFTPKEIQWRNFSEGVKLSKSTNKIMLVDVYTDWCTWCKKMDKETYHTKEVSDYIADKFVPVRLNAESKEIRDFATHKFTEAELATAYGVQEYPTTMFMASNGNLVMPPIPGYIPTEDFKMVLRYIADSAYKTMSFDQFKQSVK